ncbi:hypothetical protein AKJ09_01786 [Labilithrix luteola]|uniref:Uncharacterized protein n=1 Tax=Labilithrix luteola TaxID=1391654 RepID=A0A0K1PNM7_9BACT|nr:hypothetical protein AKJ09_01786 [Labilithrix luteola]
MVRALVEETQDAYSPGDEDYERVLAKLRAASVSSASRGQSRLGRSGLGRWGLGLVAAGVLFVGAGAITRQTRVEPTPVPAMKSVERTVPTESPIPPAEPATPTISVDALPTIVPSSTPRNARTVPGPSAAPDSSLAEEIRLLRGASEASRASNHESALSFVEEHERRFPKGFLADERRVQKVLVLCDLGRRDLARSEARRFTANRPSSPLNARLSSSCAADKQGAE